MPSTKKKKEKKNEKRRKNKARRRNSNENVNIVNGCYLIDFYVFITTLFRDADISFHHANTNIIYNVSQQSGSGSRRRGGLQILRRWPTNCVK